MKRTPRVNINSDERWIAYDLLIKANDIIKAKALKATILESYKYKKPCHHM
jgi:hypothetical protein